MTLNAGELTIDADTIFGEESKVCVGKTEIYRDLLAVTATLPMVEMTVKFTKAPKVLFQDFLKTKLSFLQLTENIGGVTDVRNNFNKFMSKFKFILHNFCFRQSI